MLFSKEFLQDNMGNYVRGTREIIDHSRWSIHYQQVFEHEGRFYLTSYSVGATESQDERPYEYDDDEIECPEVAQVEKLVKVWEVIS